MLFDSTLCVGCRACQTACKVANGLPADTVVAADGGVYDAPVDLNCTTKNVIKAVPVGDGVQLHEAAVHALRRPVLRLRLHARRAPQGGRGTADDRGRAEGHRHRPLGQGHLRRLPLLPDRLRVQRPQVRVVRGVPAHREVRALPAPRRPGEAGAARRREPGLRRGVPAPGGDLRRARGAARGGEAARRGRPGALRRRTSTARARAAGRRCSTSPPRAPTFQQLGLPALSPRSAAQLSESVSHAPYLHGFTPVALYAAMAFVIRRNAAEGRRGARRRAAR